MTSERLTPAKPSPSSELGLFAQLALLNLLWAPVNLMVRYAQAAGFSSAGIGLVRWILVSVGVFGLLQMPWFRTLVQPRWPSKRSAVFAAFIGLACVGPAHLLYYVTLSRIPTTEGAVFNATAPFWVALMAWTVLKERIEARTRWALALGAVGTYIVTVGFGLPDLHAIHGHLGSSLLYLLGTLLETFGGTLAIYLVRRSSGITVFAWETVGTASAMVVAPFLFPAALPLAVAPFGVGWLPLAYMVIGAGILAFGSWYVLAERSPLSLMVVSLALQPPVAALLGYFFLREALTVQTAVGTLFVLVALGLAASEPKDELAPAR